MSTLSKNLVHAIRSRSSNIAAATKNRIAELRQAGERGATTVEWILITLAVIAIVGLVGVAVNAFIQSQISQLPG